MVHRHTLPNTYTHEVGNDQEERETTLLLPSLTTCDFVVAVVIVVVFLVHMCVWYPCAWMNVHVHVYVCGDQRTEVSCLLLSAPFP